MRLAEIVAALDREIAALEAARALLIPFSSEFLSVAKRSSGKVAERANRRAGRPAGHAAELPIPEASVPAAIEARVTPTVLRAKAPRGRTVRVKSIAPVDVALRALVPDGPVVVSAAAVRGESERRTHAQTHAQTLDKRPAALRAASFPFGTLAEQEDLEMKEKLEKMTLAKFVAM